MANAKVQALQAHYALELDAQVKRWQQATVVRAYCEALGAHLLGPGSAGDEDSQRQWLDWVRRYVEDLDPSLNPHGMPTTPEFGPEDLKPFLGKWSPHGPRESRLLVPQKAGSV